MRYRLDDYNLSAKAKGWGPGWPTNRAADMARVKAARSGTAVNVHRRIARLVKLLIDETERRGYMLRQRDTGAFNSRPIAGTNRPSNHSWGLAIDINWQINYASYDGRNHGTIPGWLVQLWNDYGFAWGGDYSGSFRDPMHFEFMGGPADADDQTARALDGFANRPAPTRPTPPAQEDDVTPEDRAAIVRDVVAAMHKDIAAMLADPNHSYLPPLHDRINALAGEVGVINRRTLYAQHREDQVFASEGYPPVAYRPDGDYPPPVTSKES